MRSDGDPQSWNLDATSTIPAAGFVARLVNDWFECIRPSDFVVGAYRWKPEAELGPPAARTVSSLTRSARQLMDDGDELECGPARLRLRFARTPSERVWMASIKSYLLSP